MKKFLIWICSFILLLVMTVWICRFSIANYLLNFQAGHPKSKFFSVNIDDKINKLLPLIEKDYLNIKDVEIFNLPSQGKVDAGPFLNPHFRHDPFENAVSNTKLKLSDETRALIKDFNNPSKIKTDWKKINLDFSWFSDLHKYDYWDFYGNLDSQKIKNRNFNNLPFPKSFDLMDWSRLRLLKGMDDKDLDSAIKDVRQLAKLMLTSEEKVLTILAIKILKTESNFRKNINQKNFQVQEIPIHILESAERYFWAQSGFTDLRISEKLFQKLVQFKSGLCFRINESIINQMSFKKFVYVDMPDKFDRLDQLISNTNHSCQKNYLRSKLNDPNFAGLFPADLDFFRTSDHSDSFFIFKKPSFIKTSLNDLEKSPKLLNTMMYVLLNISQPNYFAEYEKLSDPDSTIN